MNALMISADNFEDSELIYPYYRLKEEGCKVHIASISRGTITGKHGYKFFADLNLEAVRPEEYDLLVLPGGKAPERLKKVDQVLAIARHFFKEKKPVAAICHGPLILAAADLLKGREITGYRATKEELLSAGAHYQNKEVVVDGWLVTSRQPSDLPAFSREMLKLVEKRKSGSLQSAI